MKLDADLILPNNYLATIINQFQVNSKIGICGGMFGSKNNNYILEKEANLDHVRGAIKSYEKNIFKILEA